MTNATNAKVNAIKKYLRAINRETEHCEVKVVHETANENVDSVHFDIILRPDPFYNHGSITVSDKFEFVNQMLFCKYFGLLPSYNNNHTSFWAYKPEYH